MYDIVSELRTSEFVVSSNPDAVSRHGVLVAGGGGKSLGMLLNEAADEIERLRSLAGAVSAGDGSFREIARDLPRKEPNPAHGSSRYTGL
jgi:hypothetical protein